MTQPLTLSYKKRLATLPPALTQALAFIRIQKCIILLSFTDYAVVTDLVFIFIPQKLTNIDTDHKFSLWLSREFTVHSEFGTVMTPLFCMLNHSSNLQDPSVKNRPTLSGRTLCRWNPTASTAGLRQPQKSS